MKLYKTKLRLTAILAASLLTFPVLGAEQVIPAGFDIWQTIGAGATGMDFADAPIPAGFFCTESDTFNGTLDFEGAPLTTDPPGVLGSTDTIVERLDHAVFKDGATRVRLRIAALNLMSRNTIETACGAWQVHAGLTEDQPITNMDLFLDHKNGGSFNADLVVSVRLTFSSANNPEETRVLDRTVHFTEFREAPFAVRNIEDAPFLLDNLLAKTAIDTNADGDADRVVSKAGFDTTPFSRLTTLLTPSSGQICDGDLPALTLVPEPDCVPVTVVHTSPNHNHVTVPPCGGQLALTSDWCTQTLDLPDLEEKRRLQNFSQHRASTALFMQLKSMHKKGLLKEDPRSVFEDLVAKTQ